MKTFSNPLLIQLVLVGVIIGAISFAADYGAPEPEVVLVANLPAAAAATDIATTSVATSTKPLEPAPKATTTPIKATTVATESVAKPPENREIKRVLDPYSTPPLPSSLVNERSRAALVNILCASSGSLRPISASGVIVDQKGIILTNAHVAQYVLLAQTGRFTLECVVRTGSPATARWIPRVVYLPPAWIQEHASEITTSDPEGTGEHDYALLSIAASVDDSPLPAIFPALRPDIREGIAFVGDPVLVASYPAEFLGALAANNNLYSASSPTTVRNMLTFAVNSVDALSLGGIIAAQSGSSGGSVANAWGYLVGIITTMTDGVTTDDRDLRAVTLSYINRDIKAQSGSDLATMLATDPAIQSEDYAQRIAPPLVELLLKQIRR